MNFLKLKYFVDIANCGSISAAARKNIIAQQSMSACLSSLEKHYGVDLFIRSMPLRLTPEGERLYDTASKVLSLMHSFEQSLHSNTDSLLIGLAFSGTPPFMADIIDAVNTKRNTPLDVQIRTDCADRAQLPEDVELFFGMTPPENYEKVALLEDTYVVVVTEKLFIDTFQDQAEHVRMQVIRTASLEPLKKLPFAAFAQNNHLPAFFNGLNIISKSNSSDIISGMCRKGRCAVLVAQDHAKREFADASDLILFPVEIPGPEMVLYVYYRKYRTLSEGAKQFISVARHFFS